MTAVISTKNEGFVCIKQSLRSWLTELLSGADKASVSVKRCLLNIPGMEWYL
ncbi:hypothetical protein BFAG_00292 [Bacteroides fragilis 3_1_12]|uniref:Uncharacterized protein n=1 Tax=Bacteroides fragilis 3_1_12 TaxID=457424 RepID=A0ABN0BFA9_BACFG|nr:hypothetical protein BFAG_00292 [Bacteroides fragilis 3_1_12]